MLKTKIMGEGEQLEKNMKVLNRRIGWGPQGNSYEADTKHIPAMLKALNMEHCKSLNTPGAKKDEIKSNMQNEIEMENWAATKFRAVVATCNYLSADRPDIQFATKECSKRLAKPVQADWDMLKHLLRYLAGKARAVQWFWWRPCWSGLLRGYSDSDWVGCRVTRKSTTGGCVSAINGHLLKSWSKNQSVVATSSGEAELYAATKCGAELLGIRSIGEDLGFKMDIELKFDANATIGMLHRTDLGKMRHVDVSELWLQSVVKNKKILLKKVLGTRNPADMMTKYLGVQESGGYMSELGFEFI